MEFLNGVGVDGVGVNFPFFCRFPVVFAFCLFFSLFFVFLFPRFCDFLRFIFLFVCFFVSALLVSLFLFLRFSSFFFFSVFFVFRFFFV